jgi:hypothetical protein
MTQDSAEQETYMINVAAKTPTTTTLESLLIAKLGSTAGRRFYKEIAAAVKDSTKDVAGFPAILLDTRGGQFAALNKSN